MVEARQLRLLERFVTVHASLIAEVDRLATVMPKSLTSEDGPFCSVMPDFCYFEDSSRFDLELESNADKKALYQALTRTHKEVLAEFGVLVSKICETVVEFAEYTQNYTVLESFVDADIVDVHELRVLALFTVGVLTMLLDHKFNALTRERLFVASQRLGKKRYSYFETSISLLRRRPGRFEGCLFNLGISPKFVDNVLHFLRSCNFSTNSASIVPERQAAMLYVCLWFSPQTLSEQFSAMRQLVDLFFPSSWVISLYPDLTVNLMDKWREYKAAHAALVSAFTPDRIQQLNKDALQTLKKNKIPSGLLSLARFDEYTRLIVECNRSSKWLLLHKDNGNRLQKSKGPVPAIIHDLNLFDYVLTLCHFEFKLSQSVSYVIAHCDEESEKLRARLTANVHQLLILLESGAGLGPDDLGFRGRFVHWTTVIGEKVGQLNGKNANVVKHIDQIKVKIDEMLDLASDGHLVLQQYLRLILKDIANLRVIFWVSPAHHAMLCRRCDSTYLFGLVRDWIPKLEQLLQTEPLQLKYLFHKLMDAIPIHFAHLKDPSTVQLLSLFYFKKLELLLKQVVQAVPRSIFAELVDLQSLFLDDSACFIEKSRLRQVAHIDQRRLLAQKTCTIGRLSLGISNMNLTQLGPIPIKPEEMLFQGLQAELRIHLTTMLNRPSPLTDLVSGLRALHDQLQRLRQAFVFTCQQVGIDGVQVWQTELKDTVTRTVQQAASNHLTSEKNTADPTVIDNLFATLLTRTDPRTSTYVDKEEEWWNVTRNKVQFSCKAMVSADNWLAEFILTEMVSAFWESAFHLENKLVSLLIKHQQAAWPSGAFVIDNYTKSPLFFQFYADVLPIVLKLGQMRLLCSVLTGSVQEKSVSEMSMLTKATNTAFGLLSLKSHSGESNEKLTAVFYKTGASIPRSSGKPLPSAAKHRVAILVLSVLSHCLSTNCVSNKKNEFVDLTTFLVGIRGITETLGLTTAFSRVLPLVASDSTGSLIARQLKIDKTTLPFAKMPEALRRS